MTTLKKLTLRLALIGILASLCQGAEPAETPELRFQPTSSPSKIEWKKTDRPSILPSHMAYFSVEWHHLEPTVPSVEAVFKTSAGESISQLQREFLETQKDIATASLTSASSGSLQGMRYVRRRSHYTLYAVSKEDARKMAEAFVSVFLSENNAAVRPHLDEFVGQLEGQRAKCLKEIEALKEETPKKERELKGLRVQLAEVKKVCGYQSKDQAQKAMRELNTMLNTESIELAGLLAKRKSIERHKSLVEKKIKSDDSSLITSWQPILLSLEQKYIDLMIDLDVAKAKEETALTLRRQAQAFLDLSDHVSQLNHAVSRFEPNLSQLASNLASLEQLLAQPKPPMLPLKILRDEVGICPVIIKLVE